MKLQQSIVEDLLPAIGQRSESNNTLFYNGYSAKKTRGHGYSVIAVVLVHLGLIAVMFTHTTQYKPLNIINPAENVSVVVTMVAPEEQEPIIPPAPPQPAPEVLTTAVAKDEVQSSQSEISTVKPVPAKPEVHKSVRVERKIVQRPPRPMQKPVKELSKPVDVPPKTEALAADKSALPATSHGQMMKSAPNAEPKNVSTVGCEVPAPEYPRQAKRLQQEGETLVRLTINAEGRVAKVSIARSSGYPALDEAAIAAVTQARCQPYLENGQAISVMTIQPITFKLS